MQKFPTRHCLELNTLQQRNAGLLLDAESKQPSTPVPLRPLHLCLSKVMSCLLQLPWKMSLRLFQAPQQVPGLNDAVWLLHLIIMTAPPWADLVACDLRLPVSPISQAPLRLSLLPLSASFPFLWFFKTYTCYKEASELAFFITVT